MLILSTLEVLFTWIVAAIALLGLGSLILSRFTKDFFPTDAFWMGLAVSVAVLEIWNLVLPITASITLFLFCAGILGRALNRRRQDRNLSRRLVSLPCDPRFLLDHAFLHRRHPNRRARRQHLPHRRGNPLRRPLPIS